MLQPDDAFHGFSVDDTEAARHFYAEVLGVEVTDAGMGGMLRLHLGGGTPTIVYPKSDHTPASFTILNFPVDDVEAAVADLTARGAVFEHYDGTPAQTDEKGVFRGGGPLIAWFTDPAGNVLSVVARD